MNMLQMMGLPEKVMILRDVNLFSDIFGVTVSITNEILILLLYHLLIPQKFIHEIFYLR